MTQANGGKLLAEVLVVTLPAVVLYFLGWVYVHNYLQTFGINISELQLDLQTILLYSIPPIQILLSSYWRWIVLAGLILWVLASTSQRYTPRAWKEQFRKIRSYIGHASFLLHGALILAALIALSILSARVVRIAALMNANQLWETEGVRIETMFKEPEPGATSSSYENYRACNQRRALSLIFSDRDAYYLLCISSIDRTSAVVFEVRRNTGLASMRLIQRAD